MNFHFDNQIQVNAEPEFKNLYPWAINEVDEHGEPVGYDLIPWRWTLNFVAVSSVFHDSIGIGSESLLSDTAGTEPKELSERKVIELKLRPGHPEHADDYVYETTYSMLGTDRTIRNFRLSIHPTDDSSETPHCQAMGVVSYTAEFDFREETEDDSLSFHLFVPADSFDRYASIFSQGQADEVVLSIGRVNGFYSGWSPSATTNRIKVLTRNSEHEVSNPDGCDVDLPRLGLIGVANLFVNRHQVFDPLLPDNEDMDEIEADDHAAGTKFLPSVVDKQILRTQKSLERAAWWIVGLLIVVVFVVFNR